MKKLLLIACMSVILASCYNDKYDQLYPAKTTSVDYCDTATNPSKFSTGVGTIITSKCASTGCHNAATMQSGYNFSSHGVDSAASVRIQIRVSAGQMPPASSTQLTECEKKQIYYWINHGSLNN